MIVLGLVSAAIFGYGIYIICSDEPQIEDEDNLGYSSDEDSDSDSYTDSDATCDDEQFNDAVSMSEDSDNQTDDEMPDLIEMNDDEMSDLIEMNDDDEMPDLIEMKIEDDQIDEDLWSSYQLEKKYNEMSQKKGLKDYLNLKEWKMGVRRRFKEFLNSQGFQESPSKFIQDERGKRNQNEYAVIDDTALNLVEYYQLVSSGDQLLEMKSVV